MSICVYMNVCVCMCYYICVWVYTYTNIVTHSYMYILGVSKHIQMLLHMDDKIVIHLMYKLFQLLFIYL